MARQRDKAGQFAEDFVPELPLERYMNTHLLKATFGVDSSVAAFEDDGTGMQAEIQGDAGNLIGRKWVLFGGILQPLELADMDIAGDDFLQFRAQLLKGVKTALLPLDDEDVIATADIHHVTFGAASFFHPHWPIVFDIAHPQAFFAKSISLVIQGNNTTLLASNTFCAKLYYGWADAIPADLLAILQQKLGD